MVIKTKYRLGEYLIAEDEHSLLKWETHSNFGVQRSGKCYIFGNILIIGNWSNEESGYLQLEFSELLQKLPIWNRTRYYCFISDLLNVSTGQSITKDFLENYKTLPGNTIAKPITNISPGIFRLVRYQITVADNGEVSWQTYEGLAKVVSGICVIESDVLLIGPQEDEKANQNKREFLDKLNKLPKWDKTMAWCRSSMLRPCNAESQQTENPAPSSLHQYIMDKYTSDEKPDRVSFNQLHFNQYKKPSKRLLQLNFNWLETVWSWKYEGRRWLKYIIPLVLVGLLIGLLMIWYSAEKKTFFHHGSKQHHREHGD